MKSLNTFWTLKCFMTGKNIFHIFMASFIHSHSVPSKWNILYHSCFCCLLFLLIWMYWFWIGNCTQTSHNNSFNTEYFTWKTESCEQRVFSYRLVLWGEWFSFSFKNLTSLLSVLIGFAYCIWALKISVIYWIVLSFFLVSLFLMYCEHLNSNT